MIVYTHEGGYGNVNVKQLDDIIRALPMEHPGRQDLIDLLYNYECLMRVIEGKGHIFRHEDGSETRRIKIY